MLIPFLQRVRHGGQCQSHVYRINRKVRRCSVWQNDRVHKQNLDGVDVVFLLLLNVLASFNLGEHADQILLFTMNTHDSVCADARTLLCHVFQSL